MDKLAKQYSGCDSRLYFNYDTVGVDESHETMRGNFLSRNVDNRSRF